MIGVLLLSAFWATPAVQAQSTNVVCASNYTYLYNQQGQNPCLVSAYLQAPCSRQGSNFAIQALDAGGTYVGPTKLDANFCTCSTVTYALTSACAQCQGLTWVSWAYWRGGCGDEMVTIAGYPLDLPSGTGVPNWAYQNVTVTGSWNQSLALPQASAAPESTYYGTPTASISYRPTSSDDAATQTGAAGTSNGKGKSNAGPIAGGVIGGITLLAIIGALVWWRRRRRRQQEDIIPAPTAYYTEGVPRMDEGNFSPDHLLKDETPYPAMADYRVTYPSPSPTMFSGSRTNSTPPKLYDPNDPSTFPKTPASFGYQSTAVNYSQASLPNQHDTSSPVGRYSGVAEVYKP